MTATTDIGSPTIGWILSQINEQHPTGSESTNWFLLNRSTGTAQGSSGIPGAIVAGTATDHGNVELVKLANFGTHIDICHVWYGAATVTSPPRTKPYGRMPDRSPDGKRRWPQDANSAWPDLSVVGFWTPLEEFDTGDTDLEIDSVELWQPVAGLYVGSPTRVLRAGASELIVPVATAATHSGSGAGMLIGRQWC